MEYEPILDKSNSSVQGQNFVAIPIPFEQRLRSMGDASEVSSPRKTWDDVIDSGFISREEQSITLLTR